MAALVAYKGTVNPALALGQAFVRSRSGTKAIRLDNEHFNAFEGFPMSGFSGLALFWVGSPRLYVR